MGDCQPDRVFTLATAASEASAKGAGSPSRQTIPAGNWWMLVSANLTAPNSLLMAMQPSGSGTWKVGASPGPTLSPYAFPVSGGTSIWFWDTSGAGGDPVLVFLSPRE